MQAYSLIEYKTKAILSLNNVPKRHARDENDAFSTFPDKVASSDLHACSALLDYAGMNGLSQGQSLQWYWESQLRIHQGK